MAEVSERASLGVFEFFRNSSRFALQLDSFLDGIMFRPDNLSLFETNSALSRGMKLLQTLQSSNPDEIPKPAPAISKNLAPSFPRISAEDDFPTPRFRSPPKTPLLKLRGNQYGTPVFDRKEFEKQPAQIAPQRVIQNKENKTTVLQGGRGILGKVPGKVTLQFGSDGVRTPTFASSPPATPLRKPSHIIGNIDLEESFSPAPPTPTFHSPPVTSVIRPGTTQKLLFLFVLTSSLQRISTRKRQPKLHTSLSHPRFNSGGKKRTRTTQHTRLA